MCGFSASPGATGVNTLDDETLATKLLSLSDVSSFWLPCERRSNCLYHDFLKQLVSKPEIELGCMKEDLTHRLYVQE
jgi:hypothetical protein